MFHAPGASPAELLELLLVLSDGLLLELLLDALELLLELTLETLEVLLLETLEELLLSEELSELRDELLLLDRLDVLLDELLLSSIYGCVSSGIATRFALPVLSVPAAVAQRPVTVYVPGGSLPDVQAKHTTFPIAPAVP
jgi:hypothetical protein